MNIDRLEGKWKQFKGELKRRWGKWTHNEGRQQQGIYDKVTGLLQERYGSHRRLRLIQARYGGNKQDLIRWAERWQWKAGSYTSNKRCD